FLVLMQCYRGMKTFPDEGHHMLLPRDATLKIWLLLLVTAIEGGRSSSAAAQGAAATDNELYAGYCLGVTEAQPAAIQRLSLPLDQGLEQEIAQQIHKQQQ